MRKKFWERRFHALSPERGNAINDDNDVVWERVIYIYFLTFFSFFLGLAVGRLQWPT